MSPRWVVLFILAAPCMSRAEEKPREAPGWSQSPRVHAVAVLAADFGFTELASVQLTNGDTRTLHLNQGGMLALGVSVPLTPAALFEGRATAGVKYAGIEASNGGITSLSFPIELLLFVHEQNLGFGLGGAYMLFPSLSGSGFAANVNPDISSEYGAVAKIEYTWHVAPAKFPALRAVQAGLRYGWTKMTINGGSYDGHSLGGEFSVFF